MLSQNCDYPSDDLLPITTDLMSSDVLPSLSVDDSGQFELQRHLTDMSEGRDNMGGQVDHPCGESGNDVDGNDNADMATTTTTVVTTTGTGPCGAIIVDAITNGGDDEDDANLLSVCPESKNNNYTTSVNLDLEEKQTPSPKHQTEQEGTSARDSELGPCAVLAVDTRTATDDVSLSLSLSSGVALLFDFAKTPDLDLGFTLSALRTGVTTIGPTADFASLSKNPSLENTFSLEQNTQETLAATTATSISAAAIISRPNSVALSGIVTLSSCNTLDTLGTFGFPDSRRVSISNASTHTCEDPKPNSDDNKENGAENYWSGIWNTASFKRRCSDVPEDIVTLDLCGRDSLEDGSMGDDTRSGSLTSSSGGSSYFTAQSFIIGFTDDRRASADSGATGTTCVGSDQTVTIIPALNHGVGDLDGNTEADLGEGCTVIVPHKKADSVRESVLSPASIPTLSTPRFALPTPVGSTYSDEDEAIARLTPVHDTMPPPGTRDLSRRLLRSNSRRYSRPSTPDSKRQEQRHSLRSFSSASDLRSDTLQVEKKPRPVTTIAARIWGAKRAGIPKILNADQQACLRNNIWLRDTIVDICIDQEAFRPVHPLFHLVWVSRKTSDEQDRALQEMGLSAEKRVLFGGMAEFKPIQRHSYIFHYTSLESSPCLRRVTLKGVESHEFLSRYASLRVQHFGVHSVSGVEEHKIITPLKGPHTVQMKWKFEYFVHPKRARQKDGQIKVSSKTGERMIRPLSFSCTPALIDPTNGKKVTLLSVMRKNLMPKLTSEKVAPPLFRMPPLSVDPTVTSRNNLVESPITDVQHKKYSMPFTKRCDAKITEQRPCTAPVTRPIVRHRRTSSAKVPPHRTSPRISTNQRHTRSRSASCSHSYNQLEPMVLGMKNQTVAEKGVRGARPIIPRELLSQMIESENTLKVRKVGVHLSGLPAPPARSLARS